MFSIPLDQLSVSDLADVQRKLYAVNTNQTTVVCEHCMQSDERILFVTKWSTEM